MIYFTIFNHPTAKNTNISSAVNVELVDYYNSIPEPGRSYIRQHIQKAIELSKSADIPVYMIIGAAMHESDMGRSSVAITNNNHFGITDSKGNYRKYNTISDSYKHFADLMDAPRYQYVRMYNGAWDFQSNEIQKAGYAQDTSWAKKVSALIEQYSLWKIDNIIANKHTI